MVFESAFDELLSRTSDRHKSSGHFFYSSYATKRIRKALSQNQIPLGFADRSMTGPLKTLQWDGNSITILISGGQRGIGKSVTGSLIGLDFLCGRMGLSGILIDPKWELWCHRKPQFGFEHIFNPLGLKPIAHPSLVRVTPACCADMDLGDANGMIHQYNSSALSLFDLETMLGFSAQSSTITPAKARLKWAVCGIEARQQNLTWKQVQDKKVPALSELSQRLQDVSTGESDVLLRGFDNLLAMGAIGQEGAVDIMGVIDKGGIILYQTSLDSDLSPILSAYIAKELRDIIHERVIATKVPAKSRLKSPIMVYADEFNTVLPRGYTPSSSDPIKRIYGQMRFAGVCCPYNTLVTMADGTLKKLGEIVHNKDTEILTIGQDGLITKGKIINYYSNGIKHLFRIKLESGRQLLLTDNHPLLTPSGWCELSKISSGDAVALPIGYGQPGNIRPRECEPKLLGYLLTEGHLNSGMVSFTNKDEQLVQDFIAAVKEFGGCTVRLQKRNGCKQVYIKGLKRLHNAKGYLEKSPIHNWLIELGIYGKVGTDKYIPPSVFGWDTYSINLFLNRMFAGDGYLYKRNDGRWCAGYSSISYDLVVGLQELLMRQGIISTIVKKKMNNPNPRYINNRPIMSRHGIYELRIADGCIEIFNNLIGVFGVTCDLQYNLLNHNKSFIFPHSFWQDIQTICHLQGLSFRELSRRYAQCLNLSIKDPSGLLHSKVSHGYGIPKKQFMILNKILGNALDSIVCSHLIFDKVKSIEPAEQQEVFDIEVAEHHNFIANGVLVHNSLIGIAPSFASINPIAIQQSDYIISGRLMSEEDVKAMSVRGLTMRQRQELKQLEINKNETPPAQLALIDADGNISKFYPLPSLSCFQEESKFKIRR